MDLVSVLNVIALLLLCGPCFSQIPCDDAYGAYCPEESGFSVGECLKRQKLENLSEPCIKYIQMHDACREEILKYCNGKEYTGDATGSL